MSAMDPAAQPQTPEDSLRDALIQTHNAVQWLARFVRSFGNVERESDIVLHWSDKRNAFFTDEIVPGLSLELRMPTLTLQFLENGNAVDHALNMEGRSPAQVEAWVLVELLHRGIDRDRFSKDLPYDIPNPMMGDSVEYSPEFRENELIRLRDWMTSATDLMKRVISEISAETGETVTFCLRPSDFSLEAVLTSGNGPVRVAFCPVLQGKALPHYLVARSESSESKKADIIEIVKLKAEGQHNVASPEIAGRLSKTIRRALDY